MRKICCFAVLMVCGASFLFAQVSTFEKTYGGNGDDFIYGFSKTTDNGYILTGYTTSGTSGDRDVCLAKTDSLGSLQWAKSYGDVGNDQCFNALALTDGYILAGSSQTTTNGTNDLIVRTDLYGNVLWKKIFCGANNDNLNHIIRTRNGDFVALGNTTNYDGGFWDCCLMKIDSTGLLRWFKTYGTANNNDNGYAMLEESDGNYIVVGAMHVAYDHDLVVMKTDSAGNMLWSKRYPYSYNEQAVGIVKATNGDYLIIGDSNPNSSTTSYVLLLRIDQYGNVKWVKQYSSTNWQRPNLYGTNLFALPDGNIVLEGECGTATNTNSSGFLIKTDSIGTLLWSRTYGGSNTIFENDIYQVNDGGLVIAGGTTSLGAKGGYDCLLLKTTEDGTAYSTGTLPLSTTSLSITPVDAGFNTASYSLTVQGGSFLRSGDTSFTPGSVLLPDTTKAFLVTDVPNDNGKHVFVRWKTAGSAISLGMKEFDLYRYDQNAWTYIQGNIPALKDSVYQVIARTLYDSTIANGVHWSIFQVIAHTAIDSIYTIFGPDSGYSVDNLSPHAPSYGGIGQSNGFPTLHWHAAVDTNGDLKGYNIYRGTVASFVPSVINQIALVVDTTYTDYSAHANSYYKISAVDSSGNESPALSISATTGIISDKPLRYNLSQNYPNPFNPSTKITFSLMKEGFTTLAVYNTLGQKVATLIAQTLSAGEQTVVFDASRLSSGIYFYKLQSGGFTQIRKMLLMK